MQFLGVFLCMTANDMIKYRINPSRCIETGCVYSLLRNIKYHHTFYVDVKWVGRGMNIMLTERRVQSRSRDCWMILGIARSRDQGNKSMPPKPGKYRHQVDV